MNLFRKLFYSLTAICLFATCALAREDSNLRLSYFQDDSHALRVEDIETKQFTPIASNFALGFTHQTTWLKVESTAPSNSEQYFLALWPPRLEKVSLFAFSADRNQYVEIQPIKQENRLRNAFYDAFKRKVFDLESSRDSQVFFLRIETENSLTGSVSLITKENVATYRANEGFLLGGVAFGLTPFLLIFLVLAIYKKQPIYIVYFFTLLSTMFLYLAIYGFDLAKFSLQQYIALESQVGVLTIINIQLSFAFVTYICQLLGSPIKLLKNLRLFILLTLITIPAYIWLDKQITLQVFYVMFSLLSLVVLYCMVRYANKKNVLQILIALLFITVVASALKVFLTLLGVFHTSEDIFISQSIRIATIPFALLVLVGYFELENNRFMSRLTLEKIVAEQNKKIELDRRKLYESFITMLVHEIKTPLSVIQVAASSLSRRLSENIAETNRVNTIKRSVTEINQIFNKCIQVVDLENGSISLEPSEFSLDYLLEDISRTVDDSRLEFKHPARLKINTDFMLLKTILVNLLSNALKYGKTEEAVTLTINESSNALGKEIIFAVSNFVGEVGLPDINQIFRRYYRSESAKKYAGSGLGLWLSQELATILGSRITLKQQNDTVCFELALPVGQ